MNFWQDFSTNERRLYLSYDPISQAWVVISTIVDENQRSIGGCRYSSYSSWEEVMRESSNLTVAMHNKCKMFDLPFSGGKAIIFRNNAHKNRREMYEFLGKSINQLDGKYITGLDLGTESNDMKIVKNFTGFVAKDCECATANGVVESIKLVLENFPHRIKEHCPKVCVQGVGKVGYEITKRLHSMGFRLFVSDIDSHKIERVKNNFPVEVISPEKILSVECDIFCPCALGDFIDEKVASNIKASFILGPANNQLFKKSYSEILSQRKVIYFPETIVGSGGVIFAANHFLTDSSHYANESIKKVCEVLSRYIELIKNETLPSLTALNKIITEKGGISL